MLNQSSLFTLFLIFITTFNCSTPGNGRQIKSLKEYTEYETRWKSYVEKQNIPVIKPSLVLLNIKIKPMINPSQFLFNLFSDKNLPLYVSIKKLNDEATLFAHTTYSPFLKYRVKSEDIEINECSALVLQPGEYAISGYAQYAGRTKYYPKYFTKKKFSVLSSEVYYLGNVSQTDKLDFVYNFDSIDPKCIDEFKQVIELYENQTPKNVVLERYYE
ncbi:hypothetical protein [Leptospira alstonii]|uniref:hypothetical protein n=1 Tax=Leptospira alstonii TaxID=28452 RepID=UPI000773DE65|nr:hypothetical protein [Leptospira alstonii]